MKKAIIFASVIILMVSSCELNKAVFLTQEEPFSYFENDVEFKRNKNQELWMYFHSGNKVPFNFWVVSDIKLEQVYLKSYSLSIKELGIEVNKEDVMIPYENRADVVGGGKYGFWSAPWIELIKIEDVQNAYPEKITLDKLYNKFKKVKHAEFSSTIIYEINGERKESHLVWNFRTKRITSLAWLDAIMSI